MEVVEQVIEGAVLLELHGELDFSARKEFMAAIQQAGQSDHAHVIVDLQGITCTDDAAMSLLVIAHQKLIQQQHRLSLLNPFPPLTEKLQSIKFPRIIPIYTSLDEALKRKIVRSPLVH
ncbi:MAG: STAS domain-containing protein [Nitrospirae bacterium]|nr:STAS domain-containing protein [Nitrospirota bacterium]MDA1305488.1 STAS domain-containing protein [Nitrospirota bacterium]